MKEWIGSVIIIAVFGFCTALLMNLSFMTFNYDMLIMKKTLLVNTLEAQDGAAHITDISNPIKPLSVIDSLKKEGFTLSGDLGEGSSYQHIHKVNSANGHYYEFIIQKNVDFLFGIKVPVESYGRTGLLLNGTF